MANILPLFSAPVLAEEDTGFRVSNDLIKQLENEPLAQYSHFVNKNLSADTQVLEREEFKEAKIIVLKYIEKYVKEVACINNDIYITNSWLTINKTGVGHTKHRHPNSLISGVMYLQSDPQNIARFSLIRDESTIFKHNQLTFDIFKYTVYNSEIWSFDVKTGTILLFPSWLLHQVEPNPSTLTRICLGFNTFVRGNLDLGPGKGYSSNLIL